MVLRHRLVLVHDAAALEEGVAHDRAVLERDRADHCPGRVGELRGEALAHLAVVVEQLVVDGDPAVPGLCDAGLAGAAEARQVLGDVGLHGVEVVGLDVHRRVPVALLAAGHAALERLDRNGHTPCPLGEAEALPDLLADLVPRGHVEAQMLGPALAAPRCELREEGLGDALPPPLGPDVDDVHVRELVRLDLAERETERLPVLLSQEHELACEGSGPDLRRGPRPIPVLLEDRFQELDEDRLVGGGCLANDHSGGNPNH